MSLPAYIPRLLTETLRRAARAFPAVVLTGPRRAGKQVNLGARRELYHFRDQRGLEIDFVVPLGAERLVLIEAKASRTVYPSAAKNMLSLAAAIEQVGDRVVQSLVVHDGDAGALDTALAAGAQAVGVRSMLEIVNPSVRKRKPERGIAHVTTRSVRRTRPRRAASKR